MSQKNKVLVKINGQEYPIVGAEPKEYLLKVGSFVDDHMEVVSKVNDKLSTSMIAVLTCINISDQYLKLKSSFEELNKELKYPQDHINELEKYIESLHNKLDEKDQENLSLQKQVEEVNVYKEKNGQVKVLKEQLLDKESDIEKAQILINDLQNKLFDYQIKLVQVTKELEEYKSQDKSKKNNKNFR